MPYPAMMTELGIGVLLATTLELASIRFGRPGDSDHLYSLSSSDDPSDRVEFGKSSRPPSRIPTLFSGIACWLHPAVVIVTGAWTWSWWSPSATPIDHALVLGGMVAVLLASRVALGCGRHRASHDGRTSNRRQFGIADVMGCTALIAGVMWCIRNSPWAQAATEMGGAKQIALWVGMVLAWATLPISLALIQRFRQTTHRADSVLAIAMCFAGVIGLASLDAMVMQPERLGWFESSGRYAAIGLGMLTLSLWGIPMGTMAVDAVGSSVRGRPNPADDIEPVRLQILNAEPSSLRVAPARWDGFDDSVAPTIHIHEFQSPSDNAVDAEPAGIHPAALPRLAAGTSATSDSEPVDFLA